MKKRNLFSITILALLIITGTFQVAAKSLGYQTSVMDANDNPLSSSSVQFNIKLHEGTAEGAVVYAESITTVTSPVGIAYFNIGENGGQTRLEDLDWSGKDYFLEVEYSHSGGSRSLGTTMVMSVPRALHSDSASSLVLTSPSGKRFNVTIDDSGNVSASPISE